MTVLKSTGHFGFVNLGQENHAIIVMSLFSKSPDFNLFSVHTKTQDPSVFEFLRFEEYSQNFIFVTD